MASLWAVERAQKVLDHWDNFDREKLKQLIAEAIDAAEEYGEKRYAGPHDE